MVDTNETEIDEEESNFPLYSVILFGIILVILIVIGIIGNVLTIAAYIRDKHLHSVYNTYLVNLAVTDLLLSIWSMPFYAVYTLQTYTWSFGYPLCKAYMVGDFMFCLESILLVMIISLDRLLLLHYGPQYNMKITMTKAWVQIWISWVIAFLFYGPAIIGWDIWTGENIVEEEDCDVQFAYNSTFTATTALIEFGVPFTFIGTVNFLVYREIRKRNTVIQTTNQSTTNNKNEKPRRDVKAAKFLAALVIVFFVTWFPYTITTIIIAFCEECVNEDLYEVFNWLLWSKAAMNPFLYAYNSTRFKKNFEEMIPCCKLLKPTNQEAENKSETTRA